MQQTLQTLAAPAGRVLLALIFVSSGFSKIGAYEATQGWMAASGVPGVLLPLVIVLEIGGGLAIMAGWQTRISAFLLAGFTLVAGLVFHSNFGDQAQMISFMKNLAIAGGFLQLVSHGPGAFSLDNWKARGTTLKQQTA